MKLSASRQHRLQRYRKGGSRRFPTLVLCFECLESRCCLAAVTFAVHQIDSLDRPWGPTVHGMDLDSDGDLDVITATRSDTIVSYANIDGAGTFGKQHPLASMPERSNGLESGDLDGDGDEDIVSAERDRIAWYENDFEADRFDATKLLSAVQATTAEPVDLDNDGDLDVLFASTNNAAIGWYENTDGMGTFGDRQTIASVQWLTHADAADLDGDGDLDVLAASQWDHMVAWYENADGTGQFGPQQIITSSAGGVSSVLAADLDGDGDSDVLAASVGTIAWFENVDGRGHFGVKQVVTGRALGNADIRVGDVDQDGDLDVLSVSSHDGAIAWYDNIDGRGTFAVQRLIYPFVAYSFFVGDMDGDRDLDVVALGDDLVWFENQGLTVVGDVNTDGLFNSSDLVLVFQAGKYEDEIPRNTTYKEGDWDGDGDFTTSDLVFAFQSGGFVANAKLATGDLAAAIDLLLVDDDWIFDAVDAKRQSTHGLGCVS